MSGRGAGGAPRPDRGEGRARALRGAAATGAANLSLPGLRGTATGRQLGSALFRGAYRPRVLGAHHVPAQGPVVLVANHTGFLDGPLLFSAAPRPVHVLTKAAMFVPPLDRVLRAVGQVPVVYESPDRAALHAAAALLAEGRAVGVFPEAHRGTGTVARARHGVAYLLAAVPAAVVPVALFGTRPAGAGPDAWPPPGARLDVVFGEAFAVDVTGDPRRRAVLAQAGELVRQQLADHVALSAARTGRVLPVPMGGPVDGPSRSAA